MSHFHYLRVGTTVIRADLVESYTDQIDHHRHKSVLVVMASGHEHVFEGTYAVAFEADLHRSLRGDNDPPPT